MVESEYVPTASEIDDAKAHSGILRAAVYVASTISDRHLLDVAFQKAPVGMLLMHPAVFALMSCFTALIVVFVHCTFLPEFLIHSY